MSVVFEKQAFVSQAGDNHGICNSCIRSHRSSLTLPLLNVYSIALAFRSCGSCKVVADGTRGIRAGDRR